MPAPTEPTIWVCEDCEDVLGRSTYIGSIAIDGACARCGGLAHMLHKATALEPRLDLYGPTVRTVYTLVPDTRHIWDVNLFYRTLKVDPRATKRELKQAYQALNGADDDRMTYAMKLLLNEERRRRYDLLEPGQWVFDPVVENSVRREEMAATLAALASGEKTPDDIEGNPIDYSDMRDQVVDTRSNRGQNGTRPQPHRFEYRSYLWRAVRDVPKLKRWQELLLVAFAQYQEVVVEFCVGLAGDGMASPWLAREIGPLTVIFLDADEEPTPDMAALAAYVVTQPKRLTLES